MARVTRALIGIHRHSLKQYYLSAYFLVESSVLVCHMVAEHDYILRTVFFTTI